MSGLTHHMYSLEVVVVVTLMTMMRMVLLGSLLMKSLVHQAHYEAAVYQGMPTSVQEIQTEGWLKLKLTQVQTMREKRKTRIHLMMQMSLIVRMMMIPMVAMLVEKTEKLLQMMLMSLMTDIDC